MDQSVVNNNAAVVVNSNITGRSVIELDKLHVPAHYQGNGDKQVRNKESGREIYPFRLIPGH